MGAQSKATIFGEPSLSACAVLCTKLQAVSALRVLAAVTAGVIVFQITLHLIPISASYRYF
jgi:hypothetical protein